MDNYPEAIKQLDKAINIETSKPQHFKDFIKLSSGIIFIRLKVTVRSNPHLDAVQVAYPNHGKLLELTDVGHSEMINISDPRL